MIIKILSVGRITQAKMANWTIAVTLALTLAYIYL